MAIWPPNWNNTLELLSNLFTLCLSFLINSNSATKAKERTRPISSHVDRRSLVNKKFIMWHKEDWKNDLRTCYFRARKRKPVICKTDYAFRVSRFLVPSRQGNQKIFLLSRKIFWERKRSCTRLDLYHVISFIQWEPAEIIQWAININIYI